ncbi:hypothetical protein GGU45_004153 [Niabella hirudinis]
MWEFENLKMSLLLLDLSLADIIQGIASSGKFVYGA